MFNFSISKWAITTLAFFSIFSGCSDDAEPAEKVDDESPAMRIVSMAPNLTEILFALGLDEEIVGVTKYSTYPPESRQKTNVGTFWQPDIEAVIALRPTLMLNLWFERQSPLISRMQRMGCQTLTLRIETIEQLYEAIERIGQAVDKQPEARKMIQRLRNNQAKIAAHNTDREKPKVLWVIQRHPFRVAGRDTFIDALIQTAGGQNAVEQTLMQYPQVSREEVIGMMPDVIIEPVMEKEHLQEQKETAREFYQRYSIVPAVRDGRIHIIDGDVVSRLGPRLDEAAELIAGCLWRE